MRPWHFFWVMKSVLGRSWIISNSFCSKLRFQCYNSWCLLAPNQSLKSMHDTPVWDGRCQNMPKWYESLRQDNPWSKRLVNGEALARITPETPWISKVESGCPLYNGLYYITGYSKSLNTLICKKNLTYLFVRDYLFWMPPRQFYQGTRRHGGSGMRYGTCLVTGEPRTTGGMEQRRAAFFTVSWAVWHQTL